MSKFEDRLEEAYSDKSSTFIQDLENEGVNSVKAIACRKQTGVKVSTRFISSKLLINAKISLASFIYHFIDTFCFPNKNTRSIYQHNKIIKIFPYLLMTDTNSASLQFIVTADKTCDLRERELRNVLLKVFFDNDIHNRLDLSSEYFEQFNKSNVSFRNSRILSMELSELFALIRRNISNCMVFFEKQTKNIRV